MLCPYALKAFAYQFNELKLEEYVITPMHRFTVTTTDITLKNLHTWCYPVYVLDAVFQINVYLLPKWEPFSRAGIYFVHSQFCSGSVALVINPASGHVSPQFHVVFYDYFSAVAFMR